VKAAVLEHAAALSTQPVPLQPDRPDEHEQDLPESEPVVQAATPVPTEPKAVAQAVPLQAPAELEPPEAGPMPMLAGEARHLLIRPAPSPERLAAAVDAVSARIAVEAMRAHSCLIGVRPDLARPVAGQLRAAGYRAVLLCSMAGPTGIIEVGWHRARLPTEPVEEQYCSPLRRLWLSLTVPVSG